MNRCTCCQNTTCYRRIMFHPSGMTFLLFRSLDVTLPFKILLNVNIWSVDNTLITITIIIKSDVVARADDLLTISAKKKICLVIASSNVVWWNGFWLLLFHHSCAAYFTAVMTVPIQIRCFTLALRYGEYRRLVHTISACNRPLSRAFVASGQWDRTGF